VAGFLAANSPSGDRKPSKVDSDPQAERLAASNPTTARRDKWNMLIQFSRSPFDAPLAA
jgi:hypothetical protein